MDRFNTTEKSALDLDVKHQGTSEMKALYRCLRCFCSCVFMLDPCQVFCTLDSVERMSM